MPYEVPFIILLAVPISLWADGGVPTQPYIYVEGKAEIEKPADMVTLRFQIFSRAAQQAAASKGLEADATSILELLNDSKIAEKDVIAGDVSSERLVVRVWPLEPAPP